MVDRCATLALPHDALMPVDWPHPQLSVAPAEIAEWRRRRGLDGGGPVVALAPGAVGKSKRWPAANWGVIPGELRRHAIGVWVLGGPAEKVLAQEIVAQSGGAAIDLTGDDLREAIVALAAASACISNDSGLLHVAAALGTPSVGIFGPTSPWHWAPLNPLAATIEAETEISCRPCHKPECRMLHHRCMRDIGPERVLQAVTAALSRPELAPAR
jgi:heptosyltransferase-2